MQSSQICLLKTLQEFPLTPQIYEKYYISLSSSFIYTTVRQRPASFYKVEGFFYSHIDNALNLVDAYTR
ncbi:5-bromo-4-chloroindolyl phosphate hydrolysis family protein, partial [Staphylococcus aureus]|uniref:5-bromo-4-chloroindolyl phosphate hydrolysis family protein n=1 Tax=Staphylococcus aureus TaxID=1280 RepID=UPI003D677D9D